MNKRQKKKYTADVVERSEYDKVVQAFKARLDNQKENLIATRNAYFQIEQEDAELRSKIDKAIVEIEELKSAYYIRDMNREDIVLSCLGILKRNLGD